MSIIGNYMEEKLNPGSVIDDKLVAFFYDRDQKTNNIQRVYMEFEKHQMIIDHANHTFKFTVLEK
jgi:hypothetical protein